MNRFHIDQPKEFVLAIDEGKKLEPHVTGWLRSLDLFVALSSHRSDLLGSSHSMLEAGSSCFSVLSKELSQETSCN